MSRHRQPAVPDELLNQFLAGSDPRPPPLADGGLLSGCRTLSSTTISTAASRTATLMAPKSEVFCIETKFDLRFTACTMSPPAPA